MARLPRVAIGTIQPGADSKAVVWALMDSFRRSGVQIQSFLSQARFPEHPAAAAITGLSARHLDSWLMSPDVCCDVFVRGAQGANLAIVEGQFGSEESEPTLGGKLEPLCQWLDLPRIAVVDASRIGLCRLPHRPRRLDGILLDRVSSGEDFARLATDFRAIWGVPVLGGLEELPSLRSALDSLPQGERPSRDICHQLGESLARHWKPERILEIASQRELPGTCGARACWCSLRSDLTIAIAYDEAFNGYFPDTLDMLEARGASVVDFSPLRDENLPPQADIVYFGCGHPERYASVLASNHCMKASLRSHLCAGRRIYAEGGGAAYLCEQMETPDGDLRRMVGVLPATARLRSEPTLPAPVAITLARPNWLGGKGDVLRGYRSPYWRFDPSGKAGGKVDEQPFQDGILGNFYYVGSLVHLNFAAQPALLDHFFHPQSRVDFASPSTAL